MKNSDPAKAFLSIYTREVCESFELSTSHVIKYLNAHFYASFL